MPGLAAILRLAALGLLLAFLLMPQSFAPLFAPLTQYGAPPIYDQGNLLALALAHLGTVCCAAAASTLVAVGLGILVTRPSGAQFLPLSRTLVNIGQTFPPVAVLAVTVPLVGFGEKPTLIALFAYGLLPIFENTIVGLQTCPPQVLEAANGMGMSARQRLLSVELPLALPLILEGIRLSLVINVGTATIGSTVAAKGLGEVIIAGLLSNNNAFILQGGLVTGLMASMTRWPGSSGASVATYTSTESRAAAVAPRGRRLPVRGECTMDQSSPRDSSSASLPPLARFSSDTTIWPSAGVLRNSARLITSGTLALVPGGSVKNAPVLIALS